MDAMESPYGLHVDKSQTQVSQYGSRTMSTVDVADIQLQMVSPPTHQRSTFMSILLVATVTCAMMVNVGNAIGFSIVIPTIQRELGLQESQLQWLTAAYALSSGCLLLMFGRIADLYGRKKTFMVGSVVVLAFTLGVAFSKDVVTLDILRGFQGVGSAAQTPASVGILAHAFSSSRARAFAFATFSAGAPLGAVFGALLGGILDEYTKQTWRALLYLLAGMTFLCLVGGAISIDKDLPSQEEDKRVDWLGAFLVTVGLVLIVFVLSQGETAGPKTWATPYIIALLVVGIVFVVAFFFWQNYLEKVQNSPSAPYSLLTPPPLLQPSLWTRANGRLGAIMAVGFCGWCCFISFTFWVILYYQNYKLLTPIDTVVRLLPMFVSGLLCNAFVGLTVGYIPLVWLLGLGSLATTTSCLLFAVIVPNATYWAFGFPAATLTVIGADFLYAAGTLFIAKFALPHEQSVAGALFNTMMQLGTALGVTVSTVVFHRLSIEKDIPPLSQKENGGASILLYRAAFWTSFAFGAVATMLGVVAFRIVGVIGDKPMKPKADEEDVGRRFEIQLHNIEKKPTDVVAIDLDDSTKPQL